MNFSVVRDNPLGYALGLLFGLVPFGAGVAIVGFFIAPAVYDSVRARAWQPTPAKIVSVRLVKSEDASRVDVRYAYAFGGRQYESGKVGPGMSVSDGIGSYNRELSRRLSVAGAGKTPVTVWVNPSDPGEAMIDRNIRWLQAAIGLCAALIFGAIGAYFLRAIWRGLTEVPAVAKAATGAPPWRANPDWADGRVSFKSKVKMKEAWVWAVFMLLFTWFIPVLLIEELTSGNWLALIALVFPLVAVGFTVGALRKTLEYCRYGPLNVTLNPFPGSLGGDVAGTVDLNLGFNPAYRFQATLSCLEVRISTDSEGRRGRQERVRWQENTDAATEPLLQGMRVSFKFEPPADLPASEPDSDFFHQWTLSLQAALPGINLNRMTVVPVFETGGQRTRLRVKRDTRIQEPAALPPSLVRVEPTAGGVTLTYPAPRDLWAGIGIFLFGLITIGGPAFFVFVSAGASVSFRGGVIQIFFSAAQFMFSIIPIAMLVICIPIGLALIVWSLFLIGGTLRVKADRDGIAAVQYLFAIPFFRRRAKPETIEDFVVEMGLQKTGGNNPTVSRKIGAKLKDGKTITVANGIKDSRAAERIRDMIAKACGM